MKQPAPVVVLDLTGKHSKENLERLLGLLSVQLKTVYMRTQLALTGQMAKFGELPEDQKVQVRVLFAEDMVKSKFPQKTLQVLADYAKFF